ncbi:MAG: endonuclease domain-containing protein [Pseudomonadota bacterium]
MRTDEERRAASVRATQRYYQRHTEKVKAYAKRYRLENLERIRERQRGNNRKPAVYLKRGLPLPPYPRPEFCECCGGLPGNRALALDHCHETGKFRGWLCGKCNSGIGLLGDTTCGLFKAALYIAKAMKRNLQ